VEACVISAPGRRGIVQLRTYLGKDNKDQTQQRDRVENMADAPRCVGRISIRREWLKKPGQAAQAKVNDVGARSTPEADGRGIVADHVGEPYLPAYQEPREEPYEPPSKRPACRAVPNGCCGGISNGCERPGGESCDILFLLAGNHFAVAGPGRS